MQISAGFSRVFRFLLLVSHGVSQVLDHIVLYSFPWFGLGSFAGVNYQLNITRYLHIAKSGALEVGLRH